MRVALVALIAAALWVAPELALAQGSGANLGNWVQDHYLLALLGIAVIGILASLAVLLVSERRGLFVLTESLFFLAFAIVLIGVPVMPRFGPPPDPIRIGSAPATPTGKLNLALPFDSTGVFVSSRWPDACELLTDQDVFAVFPQARGVSHKPADERRTFSAPDLQSPSRDVTVKNASCRVAFSLPALEREAEYPDTTGYQVTIAIDVAGTEKAVRDNSNLDEDDPRVRLGGADCSFRLGDFSCVKGKVAFSLSTHSPEPRKGARDQTASEDDRRIRYQVGTEVTSFARGTGPKKAETKFEDDHIRSELVKAVTSKI